MMPRASAIRLAISYVWFQNRAMGFAPILLGRGADFAPQFPRGQLCSVGQRAKLQPAELGIDRAETSEGSKSAIATGDDALAPHQAGIADDPLRDQFRMLYIVGTRCDHARRQYLVVGKFLTRPHLPFMLVTWIGAFQQQRLWLRLEHNRKNLWQR